MPADAALNTCTFCCLRNSTLRYISHFSEVGKTRAK